jgi:hypothetical protein
MKRRHLLQLSGAVGASLITPLFAGSSSAQSKYEGPYWIFVHASGGWDPRFNFDPTMNPDQNWNFSDDAPGPYYPEIGKTGNISFATYDIPVDDGQTPSHYNPERFVEKFGSRMTVFNGVDTSTNNHDAGSRAVTSGSIQAGLPALGALLAATHAPNRPLPFVSFGGYDATFDIAPLSRIGSANLLRELAAPNLINPESDDPDSYHTTETWERIRAAQAQRLDELMATQRLPRLMRSEEALFQARATDDQLAQLTVPDLIDIPGNFGRAENLLRGGQLALSAFTSGLGVAANLSSGGFDTHGNHNQSQSTAMIDLLTGVGYLLDEVDRQGLTDKVYLVMGSDFGRTPHYNDGRGKDHWPVTTYVVMGPGIEGDRVIGATDEGQLGMLVDPSNLQAGNGVKLTPGAIHSELRRLGAIREDLQVEYPLAPGGLTLFA